jgi:putative FmdB family regulatory protein
MPVYEYQCEECGRKFDIVASLGEKEAGLNPSCPKCGRLRCRQVFSRFTLLTGSKSESDDFGDDAGAGGPGLPDMDGMDDDLGGDDGVDSLGDDDDFGL